MIKETKHSLRIYQSTLPGAGRGVFARVAIAKGEKLLVTGFRVRKGSLADRCTHYADPYKFRVGRDLLIPSGYAGLINHSERPNLVKTITGKKVYLQALHPIKADEELFHRYSRNALNRFSARNKARVDKQ